MSSCGSENFPSVCFASLEDFGRPTLVTETTQKQKGFLQSIFVSALTTNMFFVIESYSIL